MKSTREKILRTLLSHPGATINDLASAVGINGISIRHHLTNLEAENYVTSDEERHGVGRPRLVYSLTEKGTEIFPTSYLRLTKHLLKIIKTRLSQDEFTEMLRSVGEEIVQSNPVEFEGSSMSERLDSLKTILTREGFILQWQENENDYEITILSCPYIKVGLDYTDICTVDHQIISMLINEPVHTKTCILNGDDNCTFQILTIGKEICNESSE